MHIGKVKMLPELFLVLGPNGTKVNAQYALSTLQSSLRVINSIHNSPLPAVTDHRASRWCHKLHSTLGLLQRELYQDP